uniref:Uncharacterized protein n=1 Tax=Chromera velia CCMP2878 TaxID=1169474 RepID=A0A0G4FK15_9ALVE|eukprot:Cvel_3444.t1-p1 / transcript=Cvel_3444.t1 / gene=Cvel_3444 / organism=Chromera_velia_CCMP2878 / gene_product=hypothetical protein / transcript_product=hypothetical protein / location=Cvel_scaffold138:111120-111617(+) / protein_length=166 / sequence_SO=supercontig / SO=protein_coding / is_pseudo=false
MELRLEHLFVVFLSGLLVEELHFDLPFLLNDFSEEQLDFIVKWYPRVGHSWLIQAFCSGLNAALLLTFFYRVASQNRTVYDTANFISMLFMWPLVEYCHHLEREVETGADTVLKLRVIAMLHASMVPGLLVGSLNSYLAVQEVSRKKQQKVQKGEGAAAVKLKKER